MSKEVTETHAWAPSGESAGCAGRSSFHRCSTLRRLMLLLHKKGKAPPNARRLNCGRDCNANPQRASRARGIMVAHPKHGGGTMKRLPSILFALAGLAGTAASAQSPPSVEARFDNPKRFTDFRVDRWRNARQTQALADELRRWIEYEAPRHLPAGSKLTVTITDVDMAGEFEPWQRADAMDIRVAREIYPSRVSLAFRLADDTGKVIAESERKLVSAFLFSGSLGGGDAPLRYEQRLVAGRRARQVGVAPRAPPAARPVTWRNRRY